MTDLKYETLKLSKYIIDINVKILLFFKKLISNIFIKPISSVIINLRNISTKFFNKFENISKNFKKIVTLKGFKEKM